MRPNSFVLLLLAIAAAAPAAAHPQLERSTPPAGDTLHAPLARLSVVFTQRVEPRYTSLTLRDPSGALVPLAGLVPGADGRSFDVSVPRFRAAGTYRLEWRTAGGDGHVVSGTIEFVVAADAVEEEAAAPVLEAPPAQPAPAAPGQGLLAAESPLQAAVRWLRYAALFAVIGAAVFTKVVLPRARVGEAVAVGVRGRARVVLRVALVTLVPVVLLQLWLQSAALHGAGRALDPSVLASFLTQVGWGRAWLFQMLLLTFLLVLAWRRGRFGWAGVALAAALALVPPLTGHAAGAARGRTLAVLNDWLHVLGAGGWIGMLLVLLAAGLPAAWRAKDGERLAAGAALVNAFSPLALVAAGLAAATGLINGVLHVDSMSQLWTTEYGRTLALKVGILALVFGTGFYNWRRVRPRLDDPAAHQVLRGSAAFELLVGAAVLAVTAVLVALPRP